MQFFKYQISGSVTATNPSVSATGGPTPSQATLVAGDDAGVIRALSVDSSGFLNVNAAISGGDATAANQVLEIAQLTAINNKLPASLGQKASSGSLAVVLASDQSTIPVSAASLPLPTGAATSALQTSGNASLSSIDGKLNSLGQKASAASAPVVIASDQSTLPVSAASLPLPSGAATEATLSGLSAKFNSLGQKTAANSAPVVLASDQTLPLPTGAATEATLSALNGKFAALGQHVSASSVSVVLSSDSASLPVKIAGKASAGFARNDYSSTNVTTGAYVQIIGTTAAAASEIYVFDSSGQTLVLAVGGSGSEVDQFYIVPGGNGIVPLSIPAGSRISVKAVSATANAGELDLNLFG